MDADSGLLAVGRKSGTVDLFQFCGHVRRVARHCLDSANAAAPAAVEVVEHGPGFQHVLRVAGAVPVTALALAPRHRLLVVGDAEGRLTFYALEQVSLPPLLSCTNSRRST